MKKILRNYIKILAYTITGLIFGFAFFLLYLNVYHMNEVSSKYIKTDEEILSSENFKRDIEVIKNKLDKVDVVEEKDIDIYNRLNNCVNILADEKFLKLVEQKEISDLDIYELKNLYQNNVVDECLVKQLYGMKKDDNNKEILPFIKNDIDILLVNMSYVDGVLLDNSSYHFHSRFFKINIFDYKQESYYQVVNSYRKTIDLIDNVSEWFILEVSGE